MNGLDEDGIDQGGLTVDMYTRFFKESLASDVGLFESASEDSASSIGLLPAPTAAAENMNAIGRAICKCVLDDQPLGRGIGRFVFEYLVGTHDRTFLDVQSSLAALADFDSELAKRWAQLIAEPQPGLTVSMFDPEAGDDELPAERGALSRAVIAGCRHKLLLSREASLRAMRAGFIEHLDFSVQLAAFSSAELMRMLRGKTDISTIDLLSCFEWPDSLVSETQADFAAVGSSVAQYFREIVLDDSAETGLGSEQRLHLLEWCTALTALPCSGLKDLIKLKLYADADENDLPNVHTCTHEVHLPPYRSREQLRLKLLQALDHRHDGFLIE